MRAFPTLSASPLQALERQANEIQDEITKAKKRKMDLVEAARAKSGPAALAKHRCYTIAFSHNPTLSMIKIP
jgi:hypothetical protein